MEPRQEKQKNRFQIETLEARIAPSPTCPIPANDHALPPDNPGTARAVEAGLDNGAIATFGPKWFGKAACD